MNLDAPPNSEGAFRSSPLTLCAHCGREFVTQARRRGSPQLYCRDSCRVAAFQRRKRQTRTPTMTRVWDHDRVGATGILIAFDSRRRTRRTSFPHGCWREAYDCLSRHPGCTCRRCLYNTCHCWAGLNAVNA